MESIQFAGRVAPGFGVGAPLPQSAYVKPADGVRPSGAVGSFFGGVAMGAVASVAATAFFGEGAVAWSGAGARIVRNWRSIAATAAVGGVVAAIVR